MEVAEVLQLCADLNSQGANWREMAMRLPSLDRIEEPQPGVNTPVVYLHAQLPGATDQIALYPDSDGLWRFAGQGRSLRLANLSVIAEDENWQRFYTDEGARVLKQTSQERENW